MALKYSWVSDSEDFSMEVRHVCDDRYVLRLICPHGMVYRTFLDSQSCFNVFSRLRTWPDFVLLDLYHLLDKGVF